MEEGIGAGQSHETTSATEPATLCNGAETKRRPRYKRMGVESAIGVGGLSLAALNVTYGALKC
jgi:hypothetical protein